MRTNATVAQCWAGGTGVKTQPCGLSDTGEYAVREGESTAAGAPSGWWGRTPRSPAPEPGPGCRWCPAPAHRTLASDSASVASHPGTAALPAVLQEDIPTCPGMCSAALRCAIACHLVLIGRCKRQSRSRVLHEGIGGTGPASIGSEVLALAVISSETKQPGPGRPSKRHRPDASWLEPRVRWSLCGVKGRRG